MKRFVALGFIVFALGALVARAQDSDTDARPDSSQVDAAVRKLSAPDPLTRQRGAEELAQLADDIQIRIVEGYRLQEKDKRVRLALTWALYRMGTTEHLYDVVNELNGRQSTQAVGYLSQLDDPAALHSFLSSASGKTLVGVLTALGAMGNADTLTKIRLFKSNFDPLVSQAAKDAETSIESRLAQQPVNPGSRERVANPPNEDQP